MTDRNGWSTYNQRMSAAAHLVVGVFSRDAVTLDEVEVRLREGVHVREGDWPL